MTDQQPQDKNTPSQPPAEANNTGSDNRIPQERFNQVLQERNTLKASLEEMQAQLAKLQQAETKRREAEMTELEKAQAKAQEVEQQYQTLQQQLEQERKARALDKRNATIAQSLSAAGATDADGLLIILQARNAADLDAITPDESGNYDPDAIKALVDKARQQRPQDFQSGGPGSPSNRGGSVPSQPMDATTQQQYDWLKQFGFNVNKDRLDALNKAQRLGIKPDEE